MPRQFFLQGTRGAQALGLDPSIEGDRRLAGVRHGCPAAVGATAPCHHQRLFEAAVHRLDQRPRAHVGHVHRGGGLAEAARPRDVFQQLRLAGSQGDIAAPHDADARKDVNRWHGVMIPDSVVNDQYVRAVHDAYALPSPESAHYGLQQEAGEL